MNSGPPSRSPDGRWLPGHCPNPSGRPRERWSLRSALRSSCDQEDLEQIARVLIEEAKAGNLRAIEVLFNRLDGRVPAGQAADSSSPKVIVLPDSVAAKGNR